MLRNCAISILLGLAGGESLLAQLIGPTSIPVGRRPTSAVLTLDGREAWVACAGANAVSVVDLEASAVRAAIPVTHVPERISLSADGRVAFVTSQDQAYGEGFPLDDCGVVVVPPQGGKVTLIDTRSRAILGIVSIRSGRPILALPERRSGRLFVITENATIEVVDVPSRTVLRTFHLGGGQVLDAVLHPDDRKLFLTRFTGFQDLVILDTVTYTTRTVSLAPHGHRAFFGGRLTFDPMGRFLFANVAAAAGFARHTMIFDPRLETPVAFIPGGFGGIAFRPDGQRAFLFSPEFFPAPGAEGIVLELPALAPLYPLPIGSQGAVMARDGSAVYLTRYGAAFRYSLSVSPSHQFRYDVTTFDPTAGTYASQDVNGSFIACTVGRDLLLSPDGRRLFVTNPAVDTVSWFTLPAPSQAASFYTVTPCRLADSRLPPLSLAVPVGGPSAAAGAIRVVPVTGHCGVPATARAVSINVTAVGAPSAGHLTLSAGGLAAPDTSTINFPPGHARANNATIPLGPSGGLAVSTGLGFGAVHFTIDVNGYWQ